MFNVKFKNRLRKAFCLSVMALIAAGLFSLPMDAAKRRTFKSGSTNKETAAPANETATETQQVETPKENKAASSNQTRSSRRRASLPEESQTAENKSVQNNKNTQSTTSKQTSRPTASNSKTNSTSKTTANSKGKEKSVLQSIKVVKPNLNEIREATLNPKSNYYYPKLWDKYISKSPNMTHEDFRYLYLGYMFQEDYDPYRTSEYTQYTDSMRDQQSYTRAELEDLIQNLEKSLNDNPFDLRQMSFLVHMLREHNKPNKAGIWELRLENLLGAIKSTGTGLDAANAWYVIYPMHEYDMVQLLGYRAVDIDYDKEGFDHLLVEPDGSVKISKPVKGFYFNVEIPQSEYMKKHPEEQGADM